MFAHLKPLVEENIKQAIAVGDLNAKVMPGDHHVTTAERVKYVYTFDIKKVKIKSKIRRYFANSVVNKKTRAFANNIKIDGFEKAQSLQDRAFIITGNHYSPFDSLIIRHLTNKMGYKNKLSIVVNESNLFIKGQLGTLIKALDVLPYAHDFKYLSTIFNLALPHVINKGHAILIYPEQEMWLDYPYSRPLKAGAYHYAATYKIPLLPTFTTFQKIKNNTYEYTLHVGEPIYPNDTLSVTENKVQMMEEDNNFKMFWGKKD